MKRDEINLILHVQSYFLNEVHYCTVSILISKIFLHSKEINEIQNLVVINSTSIQFKDYTVNIMLLLLHVVFTDSSHTRTHSPLRRRFRSDP